MRFFCCVNKKDCSNTDCSGCGGAAYLSCGCDACINQSFIGDGDVEICEVALSLREADMEERGLRMAVIGYEKAKNLMKRSDWKLRYTASFSDGVEKIEKTELYYPNCPTVYTVRKDIAKKLLKECRVIGRGENDRTAILCYDHEGSNEDLI